MTFTPPNYSDAPDTNWTTADLCDLALTNPALGLQILSPVYRAYGGRPWYFGEVVVAAGPQGESNISLANVLAQPGMGRVLVVDARADASHAILGDRMAAIAVQNGWSGIVLHGYARDVATLRRLPLGVHALGSIPNRPGTMVPAQPAEQALLHDSQVRSGNWLYADEDGLVIMPRRHTESAVP